eukprot:CAMPEP_0118837502 /NCGR_PEP_ID=MMETSP1162-20130426/62819_1 /TAXON_ID=33656 /ORGANISM="Phaeocystis Sp, Strain CCMP2710" /LENGTH=59 /DNA_ID=CAMNT_0006769387 /DNA_START=3 /DNA_END=178 /DNA_ORIENTATION=+
MAASPAGRAALFSLCKGDDPHNPFNDKKLQAMIDRAEVVVRQAHGGEVLTPQQDEGPQT